MDTKRHYEIISGPSKGRILDSFNYAYDKKAKIGVDFIVAIGYTMPKNHPGCAAVAMAIADIKITAIEYPDESGENLNLCGSCKADLSSFGEEVQYELYGFRAYYNSKTRKGRIAFFPN